jgi:hypothetical protein
MVKCWESPPVDIDTLASDPEEKWSPLAALLFSPQPQQTSLHLKLPIRLRDCDFPLLLCTTNTLFSASGFRGFCKHHDLGSPLESRNGRGLLGGG